MNYILYADDIVVWKGSVYPSQDIINVIYYKASQRGWNGVEMSLYNKKRFLCFVTATEEEVTP